MFALWFITSALILNVPSFDGPFADGQDPPRPASSRAPAPAPNPSFDPETESGDDETHRLNRAVLWRLEEANRTDMENRADYEAALIRRDTEAAALDAEAAAVRAAYDAELRGYEADRAAWAAEQAAYEAELAAWRREACRAGDRRACEPGR